MLSDITRSVGGTTTWTERGTNQGNCWQAQGAPPSSPGVRPLLGLHIFDRVLLPRLASPTWAGARAVHWCGFRQTVDSFDPPPPPSFILWRGSGHRGGGEACCALGSDPARWAPEAWIVAGPSAEGTFPAPCPAPARGGASIFIWEWSSWRPVCLEVLTSFSVRRRQCRCPP